MLFFAAFLLLVSTPGHARDLEYRTLVDVFAGYSDVFAEEDFATFHPRDNALAKKYEPFAHVQRVDYVLVRDHGRTVDVVKKDRFLDVELPSHRGFDPIPASDHYALRVVLRPR